MPFLAYMWGRLQPAKSGGMNPAPQSGAWLGYCGAGFSRPDRLMWLALFVAFALGFASDAAQAAEPFGRLFTTPQQRKQLDELRKAVPEDEQFVARELLSDQAGQAAAGPEEAPANVITVRGLVQRDGGRGMAWINDSNTYEGDMASQYLRIEGKDIQSRGVSISVPDREQAINIKVGESYNPATGQVVDLGTPATAPIAEDAEGDEEAVPQSPAVIPAPR